MARISAPTTHRRARVLLHCAQLTGEAAERAMANSGKNPSIDFEKSLAELEKIVRRMEQGEQSLEQTLKDFERGMVLSEQCRKRLDAAQQRVEKLVARHGEYRLEPVADGDDGDGGNDGDNDGDSDGDGDGDGGDGDGDGDGGDDGGDGDDDGDGDST